MDHDTTLILLGVSAVLAVAGLLGERARTRSPLAPHALLPWRGVLFVGLTGMLFAVIHLITVWRTPSG